jgi:hypothetical protein
VPLEEHVSQVLWWTWSIDGRHSRIVTQGRICIRDGLHGQTISIANAQKLIYSLLRLPELAHSLGLLAQPCQVTLISRIQDSKYSLSNFKETKTAFYDPPLLDDCQPGIVYGGPGQVYIPMSKLIHQVMFEQTMAQFEYGLQTISNMHVCKQISGFVLSSSPDLKAALPSLEGCRWLSPNWASSQRGSLLESLKTSIRSGDRQHRNRSTLIVLKMLTWLVQEVAQACLRTSDAVQARIFQ